MFCEIGICWFLVGPQVAICRSIVNTLDPIRFDVTLESFLFGMYWSYVVPQLLFATEWLITQIARGFNLCVDTTIVVIEKGFTLKLLTTKVAHKFRTHFSEICFVLLLLGWLAVTDWPVISVGFGFEKPENCSQNGSENPPHAAHFFWPKIHGVHGRQR